MEDWEQFFVEKSRRRFDKERLERRRAITMIGTAGLVVVLLIAGIIAALNILT